MGSASNCRGCGAPIRWVTTQNGKKHPVDWEPGGEGANITVDSDEVMTVLGPLELQVYEGVLFTSHFKTCPEADRFRKAKRK